MLEKTLSRQYLQHEKKVFFKKKLQNLLSVYLVFIVYRVTLLTEEEKCPIALYYSILFRPVCLTFDI